MKTHSKKSMRYLLLLFCGLSGSAAFSSGHSTVDNECDVYDIVGQVAAESLEEFGSPSRKELLNYHFGKFDPLYKFNLDEAQVGAAVLSISSRLKVCRPAQVGPIDDVYRAIFKDEDWGSRALILAMAQSSRHERLDLVDVYVGFLLAMLNEGVVPPASPRTCGSRPGHSAAKFLPNGVSDWFRARILKWVECSDGSLLVYLPEMGWVTPNSEQVDAIRASSPSCCRRLKQ